MKKNKFNDSFFRAVDGCVSMYARFHRALIPKPSAKSNQQSITSADRVTKVILYKIVRLRLNTSTAITFRVIRKIIVYYVQQKSALRWIGSCGAYALRRSRRFVLYKRTKSARAHTHPHTHTHACFLNRLSHTRYF